MLQPMIRRFSSYLFFLLALLFAGCEGNQMIVNNVDEREANEIVVYLASKGIAAQKVQAASGEVAGNAPSNLFNIAVDGNRTTESMALLNQIGLPRVQGTNLLTLFKGGSFMSSDREETIRYQAGLAEQLKSTILKIDGILDAEVQISFPPQELTATPGAVIPKTTASVYIKHQGILEDPNSHLESKIKRLVSSGINGLNYEDVAVIADKSRLADIQLNAQGEPFAQRNLQDSYVSIWSMVMTKSSLPRFRFLFFLLILTNLAFAAGFGWLIYRFYPQLMKKGDSSSSNLDQ